ncbi:MAG: signal peptidase I [Candidatus Parvarchaeota archaeon]|nr:signal peptidase I [Candidatus Parvarchaeota archaeon]
MSRQEQTGGDKNYITFLKETLLGENLYSLIFYLVVFYILLTYAVFPMTYSLTSVSDISAVISPSMVHQEPQINATFYGWLYDHGFNMSQVARWPFQGGLSVGSLVVAFKTPADDIKVGDIIIYRADVNGEELDVIHRVINETVIDGSYYFTTKGDANPYPLSFEYNIPYSAVVGKVDTVIPYLGYPRYIAYLIVHDL